MKNLTNKQRELVMLVGKNIMNNLSEGESARDVMAQMYVDNLDDKTLTQGYAMADAIIERVKMFDSDYREAQNDIDKYLKRFQKSIDKDKTPAERCTYWLRFTAAITASCMITNDDNDEDSITPSIAAEQIEAMSVSEEEATPEYERELHEKAIEAIKNSGVMLSGLKEHADELNEMADSTEAAAFIVDMGAKETDYRAIVSMLVYTKAKNGEFDNIPADMTLDQITTLVCAEVEQFRIMNEVGLGKMAEKTAAFLLQILGSIVIVVAVSFLVSIVASIAVELLGAIFVIPALLMIIAGSIRLMSAAIDAWAEDSKKIVKCVSCAIKTVAKGAVAIANFVYECVIKKIFDISRTLFCSVTEKTVCESAIDMVRKVETVAE